MVSMTPSDAAAQPPKRPAQHYGRPAAPARPEHALDAPLRIVLFPAWLVFEAVVRQPNGALIRAVENSDTLKSAQDTSSGGPWKELTIVPAAQFDVGLKPMLGVNSSWRYRHNDVALRLGTWGPGYLRADATERYEFRRDQHVSFETSFARRKDTPFYGLGPSSRSDERARYESTTLRTQAGYSAAFWRASRLSVALGGRGFWFGNGHCCDEPSVADAVKRRRFTAPGLGQDYAATFQRAELSLDTRRPEPARGVSLQAGAFEQTTFAVSDLSRERRAWIHWGGYVGTRIDLTGTRRILALSAHASFVDPLRGEVPFSDQVALGGDQLLLGYLRGRLVDRSAFVTSAQYTWPFWVLLDGFVHAAIGNVFAARWQDFDARSLRYSVGLGIRSRGEPASRLEALFAVGSETLQQGGKVDSIRFVVGTQHGP